MMTSFLAVFAAIVSVQVLLVVKLADFLTEGAEVRGNRAIDAEIRRAGIA